MSGDRPVRNYETLERGFLEAQVIDAARAAVIDLERIAEESEYAARRARERLTALELAVEG